MNEDTFYCEMSDNIGQVHIDRADEEIQRMQKQTGLIWREDFSKFIYVVDETDEDVNNPCELINNHCWVVTDNKELTKS